MSSSHFTAHSTTHKTAAHVRVFDSVSTSKSNEKNRKLGLDSRCGASAMRQKTNAVSSMLPLTWNEFLGPYNSVGLSTAELAALYRSQKKAWTPVVPYPPPADSPEVPEAIKDVPGTAPSSKRTPLLPSTPPMDSSRSRTQDQTVRGQKNTEQNQSFKAPETGNGVQVAPRVASSAVLVLR